MNVADEPKAKRVRTYGLVAAMYLAGFVFLVSTNPNDLPLAFLVLPFIWLFATLFMTFWLLLGLVRLGQGRRRRFLLSASMAGLPVLLLVFESIHQLTLRDVIISVVLIAVTTFYMSRADFIDHR